MRPPWGVRNYRKKMRTFRRKCRQPPQEIRVGAFLLRLECNSAVRPAPRRRSGRTASDRSSRLDELVTRLAKVKTSVHVPISAWRVGRTDLTGLVKGGSAPNSPVQQARGHGGPASPGTANRVKTELRPVTETCTAAVTTISVSPSRYTAKVGPGL